MDVPRQISIHKHAPNEVAYSSVFAAMTSSPELPPPVWIRTSLDAFLAVEYALRCHTKGHIHIYNNVPPSEERDALVQAGNVIIWDEPKKSHKQRWKYSSTTTWSNSRMIGNFLVRL